MDTTVVPVNLSERSYAIHVGHGILGKLGPLLAEKFGKAVAGQQAFVVTDETVGPHYAAVATESLVTSGFIAAVATLPPGEGTKSLRHAEGLYDWLIDYKADRRSTIVALGGGVIGDLAGFVAATYARGIAFVQVPTTLLAMVDASVGGKVAVDHPKAKNIIGAFHQPALVCCDLSLLATLPDRQYRCGLAEIVKHGVILDAKLFEYIETNAEQIAAREPGAIQHLVVESCRIKAAVVERDEHETTGLRAKLNYGHTFAHALETAAGYAKLEHGEAVAIGMICAGLMAQRLGLVDEAFCRRQEELWRRLSLPTRLDPELLNHDLVEIMRRDKKAQAGKLRFILPTAMGAVELFDNIDESLVTDVLHRSARP